jgi:type VI secretion system ImpH/TssG family protein
VSRADFFAQLATIERTHAARIGADHPVDEPVRFVPSAELGFAARDATASSDPRAWVTNFLSLTGADSPLPPYLVEELAREDVDRPVRRALLTPFHHRATALLFRSVQRCRVPEVTRSRSDAWPSRLVGLTRVDADTDATSREVALVLAPLLYGPPSASSLARALGVISRRWLGGAPIALQERTGGRVAIDRSARACLGATRLGDTAVLGSSVADPSSRATITIGPLAADVRGALDRDRAAHRALALTTRWLGDAGSEIEIVVRSDEARAHVGAARLGQSKLGARNGAARLRHVVLDATG